MQYTLTIDDTVDDLFGNRLDGSGNGLPGSNFTLIFTSPGLIPPPTTGPNNTTPPGNPSGTTDLPVNSASTYMAGTRPDVASDAAGDFVVVWTATTSSDVTAPWVAHAS